MFIAKELLRLVNDEDGLTIVEYAIAGGLVAAGVVAAFTNLGTNVSTVIGGLCDAVGEGAQNAIDGGYAGGDPAVTGAGCDQ